MGTGQVECKCFNTNHEHHKGKACTDIAEANGYCRRCNEARRKDFRKPDVGPRAAENLTTALHGLPSSALLQL